MDDFALDEDGCYFHGYEPIPETYYRICLECGHCYLTPEELLHKYNEEGRIGHETFAHLYEDSFVWVDETDADNIFFCAWCTHDF